MVILICCSHSLMRSDIEIFSVHFLFSGRDRRGAPIAAAYDVSDGFTFSGHDLDFVLTTARNRARSIRYVIKAEKYRQIHPVLKNLQRFPRADKLARLPTFSHNLWQLQLSVHSSRVQPFRGVAIPWMAAHEKIGRVPRLVSSQETTNASEFHILLILGQICRNNFNSVLKSSPGLK
jgi:hypothetical protein